MDYASSSKGARQVVGPSIAAVLAISFVAVRFYARRHYKTVIAWDDWWILVGLLTMFLEGSFFVASTLVGVSQISLSS